MGMTQVPEGRRIFAELTVYENLLMGAYIESDKAKIKRDIDEIYTIFPRLGERKTRWQAHFRAANSRCSQWDEL